MGPLNVCDTCLIKDTAQCRFWPYFDADNKQNCSNNKPRGPRTVPKYRHPSTGELYSRERAARELGKTSIIEGEKSIFIVPFVGRGNGFWMQICYSKWDQKYATQEEEIK